MDWQPQDVENLQKRVAKLEAQTRRLKQLAITIILLPTLLLLMGQVPSKKTVEANEFILKDQDGAVRGRMYIRRDVAPPFGPDGLGRWETGLEFLDPNGHDRVQLQTIDGAGGFSSLSVKYNHSLVFVTADSGKGATVETWDPDNFRAVLGTTYLTTPSTGEQLKTSAASLVLSRLNQGVIWKAP